MHSDYVERVVDLLDPSVNRIHNLSVDEARTRVGLFVAVVRRVLG